MTHRFNPPGMWQPDGRAFNQGVVQGEGAVVHVTGQVAWDEHGAVVGTGDIEAQMEKSVDNVRLVLDEVGGTLSDIVSMTIYFLDRADLPVIQRVRARHFPAGTAPASIIIQVPGLVVPELLVELVPIAVVPYGRFRPPRER
ncbi:RidA family protein [Kibdelosporangium persicum]|uniref:Endoribonuclease L-PSP n=1 Tax=Kibdelosporangium persicum TaxID=2698649 RepID=A0ABX2FE33_9PSEU|nr:RidA family protein [Kibdelosporangium persicum]NRN69625.1 Endoribonuclease L-PSP [Kibdelosporangium persicum]